MTQADRLKAFLVDLAALREKYGLEIGGCGECGSPWVDDVFIPGGQNFVGEHLIWKGDGYTFDDGSILNPTPKKKWEN